MILEKGTLERISKDFPGQVEARVIELLSSYSGLEPARVIRDILVLSKGSLDRIKQYVEAAQIDYRDVLYWAEYQSTDPLFRDRDPKPMVDDLISQWGDKEQTTCACAPALSCTTRRALCRVEHEFTLCPHRDIGIAVVGRGNHVAVTETRDRRGVQEHAAVQDQALRSAVERCGLQDVEQRGARETDLRVRDDAKS